MARLITRNRTVLLVDLFLIVVSALGSFALRTDLGPLFTYYIPQGLLLMGISLIVKPVVFYIFGLYRRLWVYASVQELKLIVFAVTTSSVLVSMIIVLLRAVQILPHFPRSTLPIDWLLTLVLVGGFRFSLRLLSETQSSSQTSSRTRRVLIVGAGDAGALRVYRQNSDEILYKRGHRRGDRHVRPDDEPGAFRQPSGDGGRRGHRLAAPCRGWARDPQPPRRRIVRARRRTPRPVRRLTFMTREHRF